MLGKAQKKQRKTLIQEEDLTKIEEERKLKSNRIYKGTQIANKHNKEKPASFAKSNEYCKFNSSHPVSRQNMRGADKTGPKYDVKLIMKNQDLFNIKIQGEDKKDVINVPTHTDETTKNTKASKQTEIFEVKNIVASPLSQQDKHTIEGASPAGH